MAASYILLALTTFCFVVVAHSYKACYHYGVMDEEHCITESSFSYVSCQPLSEATGNKSDKGLIWLPYGGIAECEYPKSKCRCYVHNFWNWYDQGCECYNPSPIPDFPSIGVIRWTGNYEDEHWHDGERKWSYRGEAHKLGNGNFMKKEFSTNGNLTKFEIFVKAVGRRYTKYSGNTNNKTCNIETRQAEKTLKSVWWRFYSKHKNINMESSTKGDGPNEEIQVWKLDKIQGDWDDHYNWTLKFDKVTHTAVPLKYNYRQRDHVDHEDADEDKDYTFSELEDAEESFQLSDYCENV